MRRTSFVRIVLALAALGWAPRGVLAQQGEGIEQAMMREGRGASRR